MLVARENEELFQGYIDEVTESSITIHEYVPDIYRTFTLESILEISKI